MKANNSAGWGIQVARVLAIFTVVTAATNTDVLTVLFDVFTSNTRVSCPNCLVVVYNFVFFLTPFIALIGLLLNKSWGFAGLFVFPIVSLIFEVSSVPFIEMLFNTELPSWDNVVLVINASFFMVVWLLYKKTKSQYRDEI